MFSNTNCKKASSIDELTSKSFLSQFFPGITNVEKHELKTTGFSGSSHEKIILNFKNDERVSLFLKLIYPSNDMTIWRSGNVPDRELRLIECSELQEVWEIFQSPVVAYASEGDRSALLMHDLSEFLFPNVRQPISLRDEDRVLQSLAHMHSRYWERDISCKSWLTEQEKFFSFLGPNAPAEEQAAKHDHPIFASVQSGWKLAFQLLDDKVRNFLIDPPVKDMTRGLSKTIIHGDSKLANFAILPEDKISAYDWTMIAYASPAVELGWYIAVNASRLARTKEDFLNRYRQLLQNQSGRNIDNDTWQQMVNVAILTGATTLLWNKALNVQKGLEGAREEWEWWKWRLEQASEV
jgi:hypothetical protein